MSAHKLSPEGDARLNGSLLHCDFERIVALAPKATALCCNGVTVSYEELDTRATVVANRLRQVGIRPDDVVGLFIERSIDMVVGLLGILKAGGAYLPLDPDYPEQRISYMESDAEVRVILSRRGLSERLASITSARIIHLDDDSRVPGLADIYSESCPQDVNLAYVVYTSGSTGAPKGVMVPHRGPVNYLRNLQETFNISPQDRALSVSTLAFDASVRDLFGALNAGASVHLVPGRYTPDPETLTRIIQSGTISLLLSSTPSLLRALCMHASPDLKSRLRLILVSGEILDQALISRVITCFGTQVLIVNQYGPTECTMTTTRYVTGPRDIGRTIPVGKPIGNTRVRILDDMLRPVRTGEIGQIFIQGAGLARGYVRRPDLTAERFLASPFGDGERLYRTGDLGRFQTDGELEFIGRSDRQVKVRGNRVEPAEIESRLLEHPSIVATAVVSREARPNTDPIIIAYVVCNASVDTHTLRPFLQETLPDYMMPGGYVVIPSIPLTQSGKVDYKALPPWSPEVASVAYQAPNTDTERKLAVIWTQVLKIDRVGLNDNFFELGGHSLNAIHMLALVGRTFGVKLRPTVLVNAPLVIDLAKVIDARRHLVPQHSDYDSLDGTG